VNDTNLPDLAGRSLSQVRRAATARLRDAGVEGADLDARLLVQEATGLDGAGFVADGDRPLRADEAARLERLLLARVSRQPMSQVLGRAGFWTLDLAVTPDVLSPRSETEQVLEAALAATEACATGRVLDLGVGPGTLLLAFLSERPGWSGVGVDISPAALDVARANVGTCGVSDRVQLILGGWDVVFDHQFDLVLSNPPYIATPELADLQPEVRDHEPRLALDGGPDGLDAYRAITKRLLELLTPNGVAALEIGWQQGAAVAALVRGGLADATVDVLPDLDGRPRVVVARRGGA